MRFFCCAETERGTALEPAESPPAAYNRGERKSEIARAPITVESGELWTTLHRVARRQLPDHEAEDAVQESLIRALEAPPQRDECLARWLRTVTTRVASRLRESALVRRHRERRVARPERLPSVIDELERTSERVAVSRFVGRLSEPYRVVVRLRYLEELEIAQISQRLQRAPGTVRAQLKRGLDQLRAHADGRVERRRFLPALFPWFALVRPRRGLLAAAGASLAGLLVALAVSLPGDRRDPSDRETRSRVAATERTALGPAPSQASVPPTERRLAAARHAGPAELPASGGSPALAGRVIGPDGPVAGASVFASSNDPGDPGRLVAQTAADGAFRIDHVEPGDWVGARAAGFTPSVRHLALSIADTDTFDLNLRYRAAPVRGRVVDSNGSPVAGVRIVLSPSLRWQRPMVGVQRTRIDQPAHATARTDRDGSFELDALHRGRHVIVAHEDGSPPRRASATFKADGSELELMLADAPPPLAPLEPPGNHPELAELHGVVRGLGERCRWIELLPQAPGEIVRVPLSPDGRWHATQLEPGSYSVCAWKMGFGAVPLDIVHLQPGEKRVVELTAPGQGTLAVEVKLPSPELRRSLKIHLVGEDYHARCDDLLEAVAGAGTGGYAFHTELAPGRYDLHLSAPGLADEIRTLSVRPGSRDELRIVMERGWRTTITTAVPRDLLGNETFEVLLDGALATKRLRWSAGPEGTSQAIELPISIADDVHRVRIVSDAGLYGELDLACASNRRDRISVRLRQ